MSEDMDLTVFPRSEGKELLTLFLQSMAAILPVGGAAASVIISTLFPEFNKDRIAWLEYLGNTVLQHEKRLDGWEESQQEQFEQFEQQMEEFVQKPTFRAAVLRTTDIALRDPHHKKWEMLSNIVLHNTKPNPLDDDLQLMFLDYIATFGSWHIQLLKFFDTSKAWPIMIEDMPSVQATSGQIGQMRRKVEPFKSVELAMPELAKQVAFCKQCISDLVSRGLITLDADSLFYDGPSSPFTELTRAASIAPTTPLTTTLGKQFLMFVANVQPIARSGDISEEVDDVRKPETMNASEDKNHASRIVTAINWAKGFPGVPQDLTPADATIRARTITNQALDGGSDEPLTWTSQEWTVVLAGKWAVDLDSIGEPKGPPWQI